MEKFFDDFDIYFSAEKHKEMYEYLLHNRMWLILRKFDVCNGSSGKGIYFSYSEIDFMSRFFIRLDYFFPEADDKPLKEKFIALAGSAFNKFLLCLDKYYFPLG